MHVYFMLSAWIRHGIGKDKCKHVPTRSPAHIPASSPPVPARTAELMIITLELEKLKENK